MITAVQSMSKADHMRPIASMVLNAVDSDRTRRDYERALLSKVTEHAKRNALGDS